MSMTNTPAIVAVSASIGNGRGQTPTIPKGLTASEIAEVAGRSYVAVEKAFKQKLGTTIQKEIMASRLETAQHLLAATHRPLAEIAKLSGFRSVQYLCLCFQKQFGSSPLAYRQSATR